MIEDYKTTDLLEELKKRLLYTNACAPNVSPERSKTVIFRSRLMSYGYPILRVRKENKERFLEGSFDGETWCELERWHRNGDELETGNGSPKGHRWTRRINYLVFRDWGFTGDRATGEDYQLMRNPFFDSGLTEKKYTVSGAWMAQMGYEGKGEYWEPPRCFEGECWQPCSGL